jgi:hypothetical protein
MVEVVEDRRRDDLRRGLFVGLTSSRHATQNTINSETSQIAG